MAEFTTILYNVSAHVAAVTLNRPEARNGYTARRADELSAALRRADSDDDVRVAILTGAGPSFCIGADLTLFAIASQPAASGGRPSRETARTDTRISSRLWNRYRESAGIYRCLLGNDPH